MGSRLEAIVYDFDKTIANTDKYIQKKFEEIWKYSGREIKIDSKELETGSHWVSWLKKLHIPKRKAEEIYLSDIHSIVLVDHAKKMLEYIHSLGYPQGIATHSPRCVVETILENNNASGYITKMVTFDEILKLKLRPKPAPDSLLWLADQLGVKPENCLYAGDTPEDVKAGKSAGMVTVGVAYDKKGIKKLRKACPDLGIMTSSKQLYNLVCLLFSK